jgi:hypothetical protein
LRQWPAFYGTHPTRAALEAPVLRASNMTVSLQNGVKGKQLVTRFGGL